jgi:hypothetical protein
MRRISALVKGPCRLRANLRLTRGSWLPSRQSPPRLRDRCPSSESLPPLEVSPQPMLPRSFRLTNALNAPIHLRHHSKRRIVSHAAQLTPPGTLTPSLCVRTLSLCKPSPILYVQVLRGPMRTCQRHSIELCRQLPSYSHRRAPRKGMGEPSKGVRAATKRMHRAGPWHGLHGACLLHHPRHYAAISGTMQPPPDRDGVLQPVDGLCGLRPSGSDLPAKQVSLRSEAGSSGVVLLIRHVPADFGLRRGQVRHLSLRLPVWR